jgi:hypothetical protein
MRAHAGLHRSLLVCAVIGAAVAGTACKDEVKPATVDAPGISRTEAGTPYLVNEAGTPYVTTEAGTPIFLEAGTVPRTEAGTVPKTEAGTVPKKEAGTVAPDLLAYKDGWYSPTCKPFTCLGQILACGDCNDNDGDKKIDSQDPECLGPCDNTEGPILLPGVGGEIGSTCHVDCYFDDGNGMGQDTCWWDHQCDPLEPEAPQCTYKPQLVGGKFCPTPQATSCINYCLPITPNGCDCFGCCTFPQLAGLGPNGTDAYVWIGATDANNNGTCSFASILDKTKCPRCTPIPGCNNPCGKCELCIGKTTLPPECYTKPTPTVDGGVAPSLQCPGGEQPCGLPGQAACPAGYYCVTGCCIYIKIR